MKEFERLEDNLLEDYLAIYGSSIENCISEYREHNCHQNIFELTEEEQFALALEQSRKEYNETYFTESSVTTEELSQLSDDDEELARAIAMSLQQETSCAKVRSHSLEEVVRQVVLSKPLNEDERRVLKDELLEADKYFEELIDMKILESVPNNQVTKWQRGIYSEFDGDRNRATTHSLAPQRSTNSYQQQIQTVFFASDHKQKKKENDNGVKDNVWYWPSDTKYNMRTLESVPNNQVTKWRRGICSKFDEDSNVEITHYLAQRCA